MDSQNEFFRRLIQFWIKDYKPSKVMKDLLSIIGNKDYFIITSNGDTHLELSGFDKNKIFEIEGTFENKFEHVEDKNPLLSNFLNNYHGKKLVILELGIGIRNKLIKQPIMQLAAQEPQAKYITLNQIGRASCRERVYVLV